MVARPRRNHDEVMDAALNQSIRDMLHELGHPPLVMAIFPNGWEDAPRGKRIELHQLCIRTFKKREQ